MDGRGALTRAVVAAPSWSLFIGALLTQMIVAQATSARRAKVQKSRTITHDLNRLKAVRLPLHGVVTHQEQPPPSGYLVIVVCYRQSRVSCGEGRVPVQHWVRGWQIWMLPRVAARADRLRRLDSEKEVDKDNSGGSTDEISGKGGRKREGGGFDKVAPGM